MGLGTAGVIPAQREVRKTRELARTDIGQAWLTADWKSGGCGSCKGCARPPAYDQSCPAVIWGVRQLWRRRLWCYVLYPLRSPNFQKADRANSRVYLTFSLCLPPTRPQLLPCLTRYCTSMNISRTLFTNYWWISPLWIMRRYFISIKNTHRIKRSEKMSGG